MYINGKPVDYLPINEGNPSPVSRVNAIQTNGYRHMDITKMCDCLYAVMGKSYKRLSKKESTMTREWNIVCDTAIHTTEQCKI